MTRHLSLSVASSHQSTPESDEWKLDAACRGFVDDDIWHPERKGRSRPAKRICNGPDPEEHPEWGCPVKTQCFQAALDEDDRFGVRGGMDPWERAKLVGRISPARATKCDLT